MKADQPEITLEEVETVYRQKVVDNSNRLDLIPDESLTDLTLRNVFVSPMLMKVSRRVPAIEERTSQAERGEPGLPKGITVREPIELDKALSNHLDKALSNHTDKPHMLIVGEPGVGKSALLFWLTMTFARTPQQESTRSGPLASSDRLPVLVELGDLPPRYLQGETPNWQEYLIHEHLSRVMGFTNTPPQLLHQLLHRAVDEGRCLLLFDGLDEVADDTARGRLADSLIKLACLVYKIHPGNRVVIGSRPAGVRGCEDQLRRQFQHYEIQRFTLKNVRELCHTWKADKLFDKVQPNAATLELATTPLLCAMLVQISRDEGDLPTRRVDLYERCCRKLIEKWEKDHHRVLKQGVLAELRCWEDYLDLLASLAYEIHSGSATRKDLVSALVRALQATKKYTEQEAEKDADQFLDALSLRSGLLQDKGNGIYGFPHLTFQEYLAARYIAEQPDPKHVNLIMDHLHESWWQEVHLLTIAHLGSGSKEASKASKLIRNILHVYKPPWWILRSSQNRWLRENGPGKLLPQVQLERRIAWMLDRELELVLRGYAECTPDGTTKMVRDELKRRAKVLVRRTLKDDACYVTRETLLTIADQLSHRGNPMVKDILQKYLHDPEWEVRKRAEAILKKLEDSLKERKEDNKEDNKEVVSTLLVALRNSRWPVRCEAAWRLGRMGVDNEEVVSALLAALHDPECVVSDQAALSLGRMGVDGEEVVNALLAALHSSDLLVRHHAALSLGQMGVDGEEVKRGLLAALHNPNQDVCRQAALSLRRMGVGDEEIVSALLAALHSSDLLVRRLAALGLGQMGVGNKEVVSALLAALRDLDWQVREQAAVSLRWMGVGDEEIVSALLVALHDPDWQVRRQAAAWLRDVGMGNEEAVSALLAALHDPDWQVRYQAALSLGQMGVGNKEVVSALLVALHDPGWGVRRMVVERLGQVGGGNEEVVKTLLTLLDDPKASVQVQVAESLGEIVTGNEKGTGILLKALDDSVGKKRVQVAESLGKAGNQAGVDALLAALRDPNDYVRFQAAESLERVGKINQAGVDALLAALRDLDRDVRHQAALSLRKMEVDDEGVTRGLLVALHDPNRDVRHEAALGLGQRGVDDEEVTRGLLAALRSPHWHVRDWAALYLGRVKIKKEIQLRRMLVALNGRLHDEETNVRQTALMAIRQLLNGRPIPGYKESLQKRRARSLWLKRIVILVGAVTPFLLIALAFTLLDPNSLISRWVTWLSILASIVSIIGVTLRDLWKRKLSK